MSSDLHTRLVLQVFLHDGRYHGVPDWPPSPARVFQALVAGAARGAELEPQARGLLSWLEGLEAPQLAAPRATRGQAVKLFVPNNDLDAKGGDPAQVADIRAGKQVQPWIFDAHAPVVYVWTFAEAPESLEARWRGLAEGLYQLGRGVDAAYARGHTCTAVEAEALLAAHPGVVHAASSGAATLELDAPMPGSLESLERRFASPRFAVEREGRKTVKVFSQPPKPRFLRVAYDTPAARRLFELHPADDLDRLAALPATLAVRLVEAIRDGAQARLEAAVPGLHDDLERGLVGRKTDRGPAVQPAHRVRIVPLPSIGHKHADQCVRRVLVEVPADSVLNPADLFWAFAGLDIPETQAWPDLTLVEAPSTDPWRHYGVEPRGAPPQRWRTVTPAALPPEAGRRRIDPARRQEERKGGPERSEEEHRAVQAVQQALRHAGVRDVARIVAVQREPFEAHGHRAEHFAVKPRFAKERLWHVEVELREGARGPLVIGDGRFLGLGVLAPRQRAAGPLVFAIRDGLSPSADPEAVARAFRRAMLSRVQDALGRRRTLPDWLTGHTHDGGPAHHDHGHVAVAVDLERRRILVFTPAALLRTREDLRRLDLLDRSLRGLCELRAGPAGLLELEVAASEPPQDPLLMPARTWVSATAYRVNKHRRAGGAAEAIAADIRAECHRWNLPDPEVEVLESHAQPGVGLAGRACLRFARAVEGPVILGRTLHLGGGLFVGQPDR